MTGPDRDRHWAELVAWVHWLHDVYELSVEERLPLCWYQHPGLVEELRALKTWREEIYRAPHPTVPTQAAPDTGSDNAALGAPGVVPVGSPGAGQAARYWHAELRQVLHAAGTLYAPGCPAGHRGATILNDVNPDLHERWLAGTDEHGAPPPLLSAPIPTDHATGSGEAMMIEHTAMMAAVAAGRAQPLGALVQDYVQLENAWWMKVPASSPKDNQQPPAGQGPEPLWQTVDDPHLVEHLDRSAEKLRTADHAVKTQRPRPAPHHPSTPET